jgi:hypothetical protein
VLEERRRIGRIGPLGDADVLEAALVVRVATSLDELRREAAVGWSRSWRHASAMKGGAGSGLLSFGAIAVEVLNV